MSIESGILMKNSKVLIPETLKQKYLKQIHQGHQGIKACRSRAREFVFWININNDLKELVEKCDLWQSQQNSTAIIQKYVSEVPPHPWHTIGSDLFYFQRIDFLVVVDYFSKSLVIRKIPNSTSRKKANSTLIPMISKIELKHCHSRQDRMYGSRILILGSAKKL